MPNRDVEAAWRYHEATKHSYLSVRTSAHALDWDNRPRSYKTYTDLEAIALPRELRGTSMPCLEAIAALPAPAGEAVPDLVALAQVLFLSAGITKRKVYPDGEMQFRAASCTGALYEIDLYVVCADLEGLPAGVYHFDPSGFALRRLREGDHRGALVEATAGEDAVRHAPVTIVCTGTFWRNAWKYRARTYRHFGWDNGTILANALAAAVSLRQPARVVCGFVDEVVNRLLDLETRREVAFSLLALGRTHAPPPAGPAAGPLSLRTLSLSASEVDYPLMREVHAASSLATAEEVAAWRGNTPAAKAPRGERRVPLAPVSASERPTEEVVLRRGSTRRFRRGAAISFAQLSTVLDRSTQGLPADFLEPPGALLNACYLIVHAVDGLEPGAYFLHRRPWDLELIEEGEFRDVAGYLGLEQALPADASAVVFFLADLQATLGRFGSRGYRAVQLEAGILGGKMYLAAYAQGFGASGLTFYDDEVVRFFSPHAQGRSAVFVMTLGRSARVLPVGRAEPDIGVSFRPPA